MKDRRSGSVLIGCVTTFLTAWWALPVAGQLSLTNIPPTPGDTSNEGRAITADGKYVGGLSGSAHGYFYDVATRNVIIPVAGSAASIVTGIACRTDTNQVPPVVQIILDGNNSGYHGQYETSDGGTNWGYKRRDNGSPAYAYADYPCPSMNSLGATLDSDVYYNIFRNSGKTAVSVCRGSNLWNAATAAKVAITSKSVTGDTVDVMGVAGASGRIVGYRKPSGATVANNTLWDYPPTSGTQFQFSGLAGNNQGEAWAVSQSGACIFGRSPLVADATTYYGYKAILTPVPPNSLLSVDPLPNFSDTGGSSSLAVPYGCSADGQYAVGMNYRGRETAVLWDTGNANPTNWTITDLYALAAANGTADIFIRLTRAYSIGTNAGGDPTITGIGSDGTATRAFLMTVPRWVAAIGFPGHQTVDFGTTVTFRLVTNGTDSLTCQWYKDGAPLADVGTVSGATTPCLTLGNVTCPGGDAGSYQVVVSNAAISGVVTSSVAKLAVRDPYITVQPSSRTNVLGTLAGFEVTALGSSALSYQWKRGGIDLTNGPTGFGSMVTGAAAATLAISNVQPADTTNGDYTVTVSSGVSCAVSSAACRLTVLMPPAISRIIADPGGTYTLTFDGPANMTYKALYSADLTVPLSNWNVLTSGTFGGSPVTFQDVAPADPQRFYIIVMP